MRGSTPAPGAAYDGVGGSTSCIAIPAADGRWFVLDGGTGLARLAVELVDRPFRGTVVLTHLHWDHTHGLPFLPNADRPDAEVDVHLPAQGSGSTALATMARAMSPPHFPIGPDELDGTWRYHEIEPGTHQLEGFTVTAAEVEHAGGRTFGYRVDDGTASLAYLPDHAPNMASRERLAAAHDLARGVDVLLHGGGYLASERAIADEYRHATVDDAVVLATTCRVGRLILVHHAPRRTDVEIAAIDRDLRDHGPPIPVRIGREGEWLDTTTTVAV